MTGTGMNINVIDIAKTGDPDIVLVASPVSFYSKT